LLKPILLNELEDNLLVEKYFTLDLDAKMMSDDLNQLGIKLQEDAS